MKMFGKDLTKNSILFILNKIKVEDRIKLMKLMFFVEHYDVRTSKLSLNKTLGNNFVIYHYGPFSFEVYKKFLELVNDKNIIEGPFIKSNVELKEVRTNLPPEIYEKIEFVLKKFGNLTGKELEIKSFEMLGIKPEEKSKFFGLPVEVMISKM
jgi:uncharacterized protein YwgA